MKKLITLLALMVCVGAVTAQTKKVALISVFFDKNISGSASEALIKQAMEDDAINFDSLALDFKNKLFEKYISELPIDLIPESDVITKPGYADLASAEPGSAFFGRMECPEGYVFIDSRPSLGKKKNISEAFKVIPEADLMLVVFVDFSQGTGAGVGGLSGNKILANANFKFFTPDGKKAFALRESAESKGMMMSALGGAVYDSKKAQELSGEALEKLYKDLDKKLSKKKAKAEKKLAKL